MVLFITLDQICDFVIWAAGQEVPINRLSQILSIPFQMTISQAWNALFQAYQSLESIVWSARKRTQFNRNSGSWAIVSSRSRSLYVWWPLTAWRSSWPQSVTASVAWDEHNLKKFRHVRKTFSHELWILFLDFKHTNQRPRIYWNWTENKNN